MPGWSNNEWKEVTRKSSIQAVKSSHGAQSEQWTKRNPSQIPIMFWFCHAFFLAVFASGYGQVKQQSHTTVLSDLSLSPIQNSQAVVIIVKASGSCVGSFLFHCIYVMAELKGT